MAYYRTQDYPAIPRGGIVEILEYPKVTKDIWRQKRAIINQGGTLVGSFVNCGY